MPATGWVENPRRGVREAAGPVSRCTPCETEVRPIDWRATLGGLIAVPSMVER